eukprot:gene18969-20875_t
MDLGLSDLVPSNSLSDGDEPWDDLDIYFDKSIGADEESSSCSELFKIFSKSPITERTPYFSSTTESDSLHCVDMAYLQCLVNNQHISPIDHYDRRSSSVEAEAAKQTKVFNEDCDSVASVDSEMKGNFEVNNPPPTPLSSASDNNSIFSDMTVDSPVSSPASTVAPEARISDEDLVTLSVKELNRTLKDIPRSEKLFLKQRRRLLKNRGYAQKCRTRRVQQYKYLSQDNNDLYKRIRDLEKLAKMYQKERDEIKAKYNKLKAGLRTAKSCS